MDDEIRSTMVLGKGVVVHFAGVPFYTSAPTVLESAPGNVKLAKDFLSSLGIKWEAAK